MKLRQSYRVARCAAFTLVEIMIVVLIIGLLAGVAIPNVKRSMDTARYNAIVANLRTIDLIKAQWAAENKKGESDTPSESELAPYFNNSKFPASVVGETYNLNNVGQQPTATVPIKVRDTPAGGTIALPDK